MICRADGPTSGRHKTRWKARQDEGSEELTTNIERERAVLSYVELVGQGRHNRHNLNRDGRTKGGLIVFLPGTPTKSEIRQVAKDYASITIT